MPNRRTCSKKWDENSHKLTKQRRESHNQRCFKSLHQVCYCLIHLFILTRVRVAPPYIHQRSFAVTIGWKQPCWDTGLEPRQLPTWISTCLMENIALVILTSEVWRSQRLSANIHASLPSLHQRRRHLQALQGKSALPLQQRSGQLAESSATFAHPLLPHLSAPPSLWQTLAVTARTADGRPGWVSALGTVGSRGNMEEALEGGIDGEGRRGGYLRAPAKSPSIGVLASGVMV